MNPLKLTVNKMDGIHINAFDFQTDTSNNTAEAFITEHELNSLRGHGDIEIHTLTDPDGIPYRVVSKSDQHDPNNSPVQRFGLEMVNL